MTVLKCNVFKISSTVLCAKNFGKIPSYIKKIVKTNKTEKLAEVKRVRAIKPPLRYLSADERNELLTVSGLNYYFNLSIFVVSTFC